MWMARYLLMVPPRRKKCNSIIIENGVRHTHIYNQTHSWITTEHDKDLDFSF
jgi:hypothetical protein